MKLCNFIQEVPSWDSKNSNIVKGFHCFKVLSVIVLH